MSGCVDKTGIRYPPYAMSFGENNADLTVELS